MTRVQTEMTTASQMMTLLLLTLALLNPISGQNHHRTQVSLVQRLDKSYPPLIGWVPCRWQDNKSVHFWHCQFYFQSTLQLISWSIYFWVSTIFFRCQFYMTVLHGSFRRIKWNFRNETPSDQTQNITTLRWQVTRPGVKLFSSINLSPTDGYHQI